MDPDNPKRQRMRIFLNYGELSGRVCSPWVRDETLFGTKIDAAMPWPQIQCEWFVREYVRRKGSAEDIDLANLLPVHRVVLGNQQRVSHDDSGRWSLSPPQWIEEFDWLNDVLRSEVSLKVDDMTELLNIAHALVCAATPDSQDSKGNRKTTIYVPIDLRFSTDEQIKKQHGVVQEIQKYLLALSGRKRVFELGHDLAQRRFRSYVFRKYGGLNATDIARLVFPEEEPKKAAVKVRNELKRVRHLLKEHQRPGA